MSEQTPVTGALDNPAEQFACGTHVRQIGRERDGVGVVIAVRGTERKIMWDNYASQWLRLDKLTTEREGNNG